MNRDNPNYCKVTNWTTIHEYVNRSAAALDAGRGIDCPETRDLCFRSTCEATGKCQKCAATID